MAETTSKAGQIAQLSLIDREDYQSLSLWQLAMRRLRQDYLTLAAIAVIIFITVLSIAAPVIEDVFDVSYTLPNSEVRLLPIGAEGHPLGADNLGRDVLARLLYGGRVSIGIGFVAAFFSTIVGVTIGLLAGFYQGGQLSFIDDFLMWVITTLNSIPTLLLLILLTSVITPSVATLILVLTIISWTGTMRLIRGETIARRANEYVLAAQAVGARPLRIMFVHVLPNTLSVLITSMAIQVGTLILVESALSFLGLGVRPPEPSWGNMLTSAQSFFRTAPHLSILPGLLIVITVLSTYLIGDGLRDAFDPYSTK